MSKGMEGPGMGRTLELIFDETKWLRKFEHSVPIGNIIAAFQRGEEKSLLTYLAFTEEETEEFHRALYLGSDSLGPVVCVTEKEWE
jgi:hypothetical protein